MALNPEAFIGKRVKHRIQERADEIDILWLVIYPMNLS